MITELKPHHPESSRSEFAGYSSIESAVASETEHASATDCRTSGEVLELARRVQSIVSQSLRYDPQAKIDDLEDGQRANCVGYSQVASESLDVAEVDHYIAFMNGHASIFVRTTDEDESRIFMVDPLCVDITQEVTESFNLYGQQDASARSYGTIVSSCFNAGTSMEFDELKSKYPWVSIKEFSDIKLEATNNRRLIVVLDQPEPGRKVLGHYARFKEKIAEDNWREAAVQVVNMSGNFPDIDIRGESVQQVRKVVKSLARTGESDLASEVIDAFYDSFIGEDPRVPEYRADCNREIAVATGQSDFMRSAIALYEKATQKRRANNECVLGKLATSRALLQAQE